ncbi:MAG TPA: AraC family transcriptional regulator [Motilibacteraceae bacterium]|nr:AraC family transcriptional regulator [Motilibacteraceae bacterium]
MSPEVARGFLPSHSSFFRFLESGSPAYFQVLVHLLILSSVVLMVFGGKTLTVVQTVLAVRTATSRRGGGRDPLPQGSGGHWQAAGVAATIPVHFVRAALRGVREQGLDQAPLLAAAGIPGALLDDARARVTPEQYSRLVQRAWDALDDEYLGLGPGRSRRGTFAMMCLATVHGRDLRDAVERAVAFYRLFDDSPGIALNEDRSDDGAGLARLVLDQRRLTADPDHLLAESLLVIWHRWSSWLVGRRLPVREAAFAYPAPPHAADYGALFGIAPVFDAATTGLALDAAALDLPVVQDEASLRRFLRRAPADLLVRPQDAPSTAERVRRVLDRATAEDLGVDAVAARLLVSGPTLRRRLAQEGTSFQALKDAVRRDRAIVLLSRGDLPVEEVAARLGFSEASAFSRAFRRWTGAPPGAYRAATSAAGSGSRTA